MKLRLIILFLGSVSLTTFLGYLYGRKEASREEALASLTINTTTAAAIRLGHSNDALHVAEIAMGIAADGLERYNQPFGAIRVYFNGQRFPGREYETLRFKNASQYIDMYSANDVTPSAAAYIHTLAQ